MESKKKILAAIRNQPVEAVEYPGTEGPWIEYTDARAQFIATLEGIGGACHIASNISEVNARLEELPEFNDGPQIYSALPGIERANVDLAAIDDPHDLQDIDFAVFPGELAVAENGAVWVTDEHVRHKVTYFITQHLALVVPANKLLHNMHQAYEQIRFTAGQFGVFIAGPSKTADIEQSLVIGAHGARSLQVFLVE